jgi:hypothetical protein
MELSHVIIDNYSYKEFDVHLAYPNGEIDDYYTKQGFKYFYDALDYVEELATIYNIKSIKTKNFL